MTSKKGSLWKTSWNRGRGTPAPPLLGSMSFFLNFEEPGVVGSAIYLGAAVSTLAAGTPFWFGVVGIGPEPNKSIAAPAGFEAICPFSTINAVGVSSGSVSGIQIVTGTPEIPTAPFSYVSPVIFLVRPQTGGGFSVRTIVSDGLATSYYLSEVPFVPASFPISIAPNSGGIHGLAGGPFDLTPAEVKAWFADLKTNLQITAIPGKTSNLYSAESVVGTVPAVLPNLGSAGAGQNLDYTVISGAPTPTNDLLPAYFAY